MIRRLNKWCLLALIVLFQSGCAATRTYTQAQLNAIETREVDADMEATFSAASGALFDAGYTIAMSDRNAGLLTGTRTKSNADARGWAGLNNALVGVNKQLNPNYIGVTQNTNIPDDQFIISAHVTKISPKRCEVRVKTSQNGQAYVDEGAINQIWVLMQRQVLMKEPLATGNQ